MFDHIGIPVRDLDATRAFFLEALAPLGVTAIMEFPDAAGLGRDGKPTLWLARGTGERTPIHLAFTATTHEQVDEFYRRALAAGARDNGPPGLRPHYHADYYAAFVIDPDGDNVEVVCHARQT